MKKKILMLFVIFGLTFSSVWAETSNASVTFTEPDTGTGVKPVDPVDPTKPYEPDDGGETGSTGPLTIDYVPSFKFQGGVLDNTVKTLNSSNLKPFVQVSDRSATGSGWNLSATLGVFKNDRGTTEVGDDHSISNARLKLKNGSVKTPQTSNLNAPVTSEEIVLVSDGSGVYSTIMNAPQHKGMGTWLVTWLAQTGSDSNANAILEIDTNGARVGTYTSEITWTLNQGQP